MESIPWTSSGVQIVGAHTRGTRCPLRCHGDCKIKNQSRNEACLWEQGPLRPPRFVDQNPPLFTDRANKSGASPTRPFLLLRCFRSRCVSGKWSRGHKERDEREKSEGEREMDYSIFPHSIYMYIYIYIYILFSPRLFAYLVSLTSVARSVCSQDA